MKITMKRQNNKIILSMWLLASLFWQTIPVRAQQSDQLSTIVQEASSQKGSQIFKNLLLQTRGAEYSVLLEKIFGSESEAAANVFDEDSEQLFQAVTAGASRKAEESLQKRIKERKEKPSAKTVAAPEVINSPKARPVRRTAPKSKKLGFNSQPKLDWRQFAFGFQPLPQYQQDSQPEIKFTETDKELIATGQDKKSFETKEARGTRTQTAESRYIKDGAVFGVEIKNTQIIEAVSKIDGKSFRTETVMMWGAEVAACPDVNGVTRGTGKAKVIVKTTFSDGSQTASISSDFDLQAKMTGTVNDEAEFQNYDFEVDAYATNAGYNDALLRNLTKEVKLKDGRYGIHYDVKGNTIEISDGTYGGERTPAKIGKATARTLTPMPNAEIEVVSSAIGPMVPAIWVQANEMYEQAQENWKNGGCVEVICKAPKSELKMGESVDISAETVHLQDKNKVNARIDAEAPGPITPESQNATPGATFTFTKENEDDSYVTVKSVSRRGIAEGSITFKKEIEEPSEAGAWTGTIDVRRHHYQEREKRSGANLAENGGYFETLTYVTLKLTGRLDRTVEATNANIARVSGTQTHIDHEYDRYKVDEGYCGPNAVPYKGEKEITRTSTTKAEYNKDTRVYMEVGGSGGTITFSLPEINGTTVHKYVHQSPCAEHDRVNTNDATDKDVATMGGSFSFSLPADPSQKTIRGNVSVTEEDGSKTDYTWELRRK
jgi:hypothetical protein